MLNLKRTVLVAGGGAIAAKGGSQRTVSSSAGAIVAAQRALGVAADGVVGPRTRAATRRFQRRHGLIVDGVIGPQTLRALGIRVRAVARRPVAHGASGASPALARIAACESGGNPGAVSADGRYRGKYQFSRETWAAMGGRGDPAAAPEAEQDRMAARLLQQAGTSPWPNCG